MSPFIFIFVNSVVFAIHCYLISYIILLKKEKSLKIIIKAFIPFWIGYYSILCLLDSIYSIFFSALGAFLFIKIAFQESRFMSMVISLLIHFGKILFKIIIMTLLNDDSLLLLHTYKTLNVTAFLINICAMIFSVICIFLLRKQLRKLFIHLSSMQNREMILIIIVYINFIIIYIYQPPYKNFSIQVVSDFIIIFLFTYVYMKNISGELKMVALDKHYKEIFEYSKSNEELLKNYKMEVHENKNKLLMIKGMLDSPKREIKKYIDSILDEINENNSQRKYWLTELKYIPIAGFRNFINYKLIKLKELGAEIEVFISSDLEKLNPKYLNDKSYNQLSTILGVILDNMIEAINDTEEKLISIIIYINDNKIHGEFVNSFSGEIDLNRLNEVGYTTKGENRGIGLSLLSKIIKNNDKFDCTTSIVDNLFVQHLTMNLSNKNNVQKNKKNDVLSRKTSK